MTNKNTKKQPKSRKMPKQKKNLNVTSTALVLRAKPSAPLRGGLQVPKVKPPPNKASLPQFAVAQLDPFCPEAFGAKVPDDATAPSAVAFSRDLLTFSVGATFAGSGQFFRFDPGAAFVFPTPTSSTSWTWPALAAATAVSNQAALTSTFSLLRTVAFGLKLQTRQAALTAGGFVHIALVPEALQAGVFAYPTSVGTMEYSPYYRRIPLADLIYDEVLIPGRFTDHTGFRYMAPGNIDLTYTFSYPSTGWLGIMVWVEANGLSVTNILDAEVIHHYEGLVQAATGASGVIDMTKAAPCSPAVMAATTYVVDQSEPVKVIAEDEENTGDFWRDAIGLFGVGLKIANGFFPMLTPVRKAFRMLGM